jgi:hypothetical protein
MPWVDSRSISTWGKRTGMTRQAQIASLQLRKLVGFEAAESCVELLDRRRGNKTRLGSPDFIGAYFFRYSAGIGVSGVSPSHMMVITHHRWPSFTS